MHGAGARVKAKALMLAGFMHMICLPSTLFAAYDKITSAKEMLLYPDFGHEGLPGGNDAIWEFLAEF